MARNYKIGLTGAVGPTVWLTDDGTEDGRRCRTAIPNIAALFEPVSGNTTVAAGGSPFTEKPLTNGGGRQFEIQIPNCPTARYDELRTLIDAAVANDTAITIELTGEPGTAEVDASPNYSPIPLDFDSQQNTDNMRAVVVRFMTIPN